MLKPGVNNSALRSLIARATARLPDRGSLQARLDRIERKLDALEYHSHGARATYVGSNRVLVKIVVAGHNIAYYVEADDRLLSPWFIITGTYETELTDFFVRELKPDSHCIDVGCNFGYFTCLIARLCPSGRVIGVEAEQRIAELARDNIAINGFERHAGAVHAAASDSDTALTFFRRGTRSANTSVVEHDPAYIAAMGEPASERFDVRGVRVDQLAREWGGRVDFLKIDAEGSEPLVLRGATATIADNPQLRIVMEWSPGQIRCAGFALPDFLSEIERAGLRPFRLAGPALSPLSFGDLGNLDYAAGVVLARSP